MMHPEPIVLTHREHLRLIDENSLYALYDNQMLNVARAMYEPEHVVRRRVRNMLGAVALSGLMWFGIIVLAFAVLRP